MLEELYFLKEIDCGMLQPKDRVDYFVYFYEHQPREVLILDETTDISVKDKKIVNWIVTTKKQLVKLNLGSKEECKEVLISAILPSVFQAQIKKVLMEFIDVFAWGYKELKGITREVCEHKIELMVKAQLIKQRQYIMNPNYALRVKEDLDKLLNVGFIYLIETIQWLSPLIIVPKKKGKLHICVDYQKLNAQTKEDPFLLPFLDSMAGHEMYSFMDDHISYKQIKMAKEDKENTTFISIWGAYTNNIMPFGLCNVPTTFKKCDQNLQGIFE